MKVVIGSTSDSVLGHNGEHPYRVEFGIPMLPPSVNHYVEHPAAGVHRKSTAAKAFENQFPIFARDLYVVSASGRFAVTLDYWPGPGGRGDVDNYNKLILDCIAARGMLRDAKGKELSDAWVKRLTVEIHDSSTDRKFGPRTAVKIEELIR